MARSRKSKSITLRHEVKVDVERVPFAPFQSLRHLDLAKLARASRAVVELGQFESDCCRRTARAVIKQGYVTDVTLDPCTDSGEKKPAPEIRKLIDRAHGKLGKGPTLRLPMALKRFFGPIIDINIPAHWTCYRICVTVFGREFCATCCVTTIHDGSEIYDCR